MLFSDSEEVIVSAQPPAEAVVEAVHQEVPEQLHHLRDHDEGDPQQQRHCPAQRRQEIGAENLRNEKFLSPDIFSNDDIILTPE